MAGNAQNTQAHVEAPQGHDEGHAEFNPLSISWSMFLWFLVVFIIAAAVLKKFAWGPILQALDQRESRLKQSLDNAERLETEMAQLDATRAAKVAAADAESHAMLEGARKGAHEAAKVIENKAREEVAILNENAQREIRISREKAAATLREESAALAVALAGKIMGDQLDAQKSRALTDRLIAEL